MDLLEDALAIGVALAHPVYDCVYLALALASSSTVVTADRRFRAAIGRDPRLHEEVVLLNEIGH